MPDARIVAAAMSLRTAEREGKIRIEISDRGPNGAIRVTSRSTGEVLWDTRTGFMASAERFRAVASARADRSPFRASPSSSRLTVSEMGAGSVRSSSSARGAVCSRRLPRTEPVTLRESAEVVAERLVRAVAVALTHGARVELDHCRLTVEAASVEVEAHLCEVLGDAAEIWSAQFRISELILGSGRERMRSGVLEATPVRGRP